MKKTVECHCPYCGEEMDILVSVEVRKVSEDSSLVDATAAVVPRSYGHGDELLRENAEQQKHEKYPPNMRRRRDD